MTADTPRTDKREQWLKTDLSYKAPEQLREVYSSHIDLLLEDCRELERELSAAHEKARDYYYKFTAAQEKLAALEAAGELTCTDAKEQLMGCFRAVHAENKLARYEQAGKELPKEPALFSDDGEGLHAGPHHGRIYVSKDDYDALHAAAIARIAEQQKALANLCITMSALISRAEPGADLDAAVATIDASAKSAKQELSSPQVD